MKGTRVNESNERLKLWMSQTNDGVSASQHRRPAPMQSRCLSSRPDKQNRWTHAMLGITCKRHETVHEGHASQWVKRAPKAMDEPAYWRTHHITVPTAGSNAKLVPQLLSCQA